MRILIVEDEENLSRTLAYNLKREGYQPVTAATGEQGLRMALKPPTPDLILLDIMLPGMSGINVCRSLRENPSTREVPIIMLTAKGEEIDKLVGFETGADDYVTKPFSVRELIFRIRAVIKRAAKPRDPVEEIIEFGLLRVDAGSHTVWVEGEEITLTASEFRLLTNFLARKGRVQSRDVLLNDVWGALANVQPRTVDAHIKRLRRKLGAASSYLETIRGVGYRFRTRPDEEES